MTSADLLRAQCPVPRDPTVLYENMLKAGYCSAAAHTVPVLPTSFTTLCTRAHRVIHYIVYRCLPRHTPHIVYRCSPRHPKDL